MCIKLVTYFTLCEAYIVDALSLTSYELHWRHPDVLQFNIKIIKQSSLNTSHFTVPHKHITFYCATHTHHILLCHTHITFYCATHAHHILLCLTHTSHFTVPHTHITFYCASHTHHILLCLTHTSHFTVPHKHITFYCASQTIKYDVFDKNCFIILVLTLIFIFLHRI